MNEAGYILAACIGLGLLLLFWEYRGKSRFKAVRLLATVVLMVSLFFLLSSSLQHAQNSGLLVVTPGTNSSDQRQFLQDNPAWEIRRIDYSRPYAFAQTPSADSVVIMGNGLLVDSDIRLLSSLPSDHQFVPLPEGLNGIQIPRTLQANTEHFGEISFTDSIRQVVYEHQGMVDSLIVAEDGSVLLPLFSPVAGKFVFQLTLLNAELIALEQVELPVIYREAQPLSVGIMASFPLAEINYLKNHLAKAGHSISSAIRLSQNVTTWDFINTPENKSSFLNRLETFDIIFITSSALNSMSSADATKLTKAMKAGLGVFVWRDAPNSQRIFSLNRVTQTNNSSTVWKEHSVLPFSYAFANPDLSLIEADTGLPLVTSSQEAAGTRVESTVAQSYPMLLRGDSVAYRTFWNKILTTVQRQKLERFTALPKIWQPEIGLPMTISFQSALPDFFSIDSIALNIDQDPFQNDIWHANFWPVHNGWHKGLIRDSLGSDSLYFYVGASGWDHLRARSIQQKNGRFVKNAHSIDPGRMSVPRTLWIVLCCCCFVYLWAEPRFL